MKHFFALALCIWKLHSFSFAQEISVEQTVEYINTKLKPYSELTVDRGILVSRYFNNGVLVREDQAMCKDLDLASMSYDNDYGLLYINCKKGKCVDRQMFVRKIQRDYSRISFPIGPDPKGHEGLKKAITHLIKMVTIPGYQSSTPFE
ncbi:MAG: hypothetical protein ACKOYC_04450 [Bacteroidota bacterium]